MDARGTPQDFSVFLCILQGVPLAISMHSLTVCKGYPEDVSGFPFILQGVPRIISLDFPSLLARDAPKLFNRFPHISQEVPPLVFQWNS